MNNLDLVYFYLWILFAQSNIENIRKTIKLSNNN